MDIEFRYFIAAILLILFAVFLLRTVNFQFTWRDDDDTTTPSRHSSFLLVGGSTRASKELRKIRWSALTMRERECALLAAQGNTNAEIARALGIEPRTVEKHLQHVYRKLNIRRRNEIMLAMPDTDDAPDVDSPDDQPQDSDT
mgnify:CR=1 FL=1